MMTVHEVSKISGVSIRSLHYYDQIGLLPATQSTDAGYRLYDGKALERLQMILLYKELQFPLKEIAAILDCPDFSRSKALEQQLRLLELRKEHLEELIQLARGIIGNVEKDMGTIKFDAFDTGKIDEYAAKAKAVWGNTDAYREYQAKTAGRTPDEEKALGDQLMNLFKEFGAIKDESPDSPQAQQLVQRLQNQITKDYYRCTEPILASLAEMYASGGEMTQNIDSVAGDGTAVFVHAAIQRHLKKLQQANKE